MRGSNVSTHTDGGKEANEPVTTGTDKPPEPKTSPKYEKWLDKITRLIDFF